MFNKIRDFLSRDEEQKEVGNPLEREKGDIQGVSQKERLKLEIEIIDGEKKKKLVQSIIRFKLKSHKYTEEELNDERNTFLSSKYFVIHGNIYGRLFSWKSCKMDRTSCYSSCMSVCSLVCLCHFWSDSESNTGSGVEYIY